MFKYFKMMHEINKAKRQYRRYCRRMNRRINTMKFLHDMFMKQASRSLYNYSNFVAEMPRFLK